jgi:hypothetical protein
LLFLTDNCPFLRLPQHIRFPLLPPLNKLKFCVTFKKPSQKPQIHAKPTTYFGKQ